MNFTSEGSRSLVVAHRKHFCKLVGVPFEGLVSLEQVHGGHIVRVRKEDCGKGARNLADVLRASDAAITNCPDVVLSIRSADCAPIFLLDPVHHAIGIAHVGWKGASERLTSKMVQAFRHQFLSRPANLIVGLGPMIHSCCYEVGEEFRDVFGSFVTKRKQSYFFNLKGWVIDDLLAEGVEQEKIYDTAFCTSCLVDQFPSYRREGARVRHMLSIIQLKPKEKE